MHSLQPGPNTLDLGTKALIHHRRNSYAFQCVCGCLKIKGTFLEGPHNEDRGVLGSILGFPRGTGKLT